MVVMGQKETNEGLIIGGDDQKPIEDLTFAERLLKALEDLKNETARLADAVELSGIGFPKSKKWGWMQFDLGDKGTLPRTLAAKSYYTFITEKDLPSKYGYLHSLDISCDDEDLYVELQYNDARNNKQEIAGTLADFRSLGFNEMAVMPGDPVVIDRAGLFPVIPQFIARIGPSFNLPFNTPFKWTLKNNTATDILIYSHQIYFIMVL